MESVGLQIHLPEAFKPKQNEEGELSMSPFIVRLSDFSVTSRAFSGHLVLQSAPGPGLQNLFSSFGVYFNTKFL